MKKLLDIRTASKQTLKKELCFLLTVSVFDNKTPDLFEVVKETTKNLDDNLLKTLQEKLYSRLQISALDLDDEAPNWFEPVERLTASLIDDISFLLEFPYVDRHYRDTYYSFHSSKFSERGRNCIRVHIFEGMIDKDQIFKKESNINNKYCGFFIIRPLIMYILGRSLISPKALNKERICLLSNEGSCFIVWE